MEPSSYSEAVKSEPWRIAMKEELAMIEKKSDLEACGHTRKQEVHQLDVKSAFLNGLLNEEIYIEQPEGYQIQGEEGKVYLLKMALYGLKQAPRAWYSRINDHLLSLDFVRSPNEHTLYIREAEDDVMIISLYVDDLLVIGSNQAQVLEFKKSMHSEFEMTDLGEMSYFGMKIDQCVDGIFVNQRKYASEVLKKFCIENCKPVDLPLVPNLKLSKSDEAKKVDEGLYRSLIGCLLYLTATRLDLMYATSLLSRFMSQPTKTHFKTAKRVLRYVKGSTDFGVWFKRSENLKLVGLSDSDWAGLTYDMRSTSRYAFFLNCGAICWLSRKQETVAQSIAKAEYISDAAAVNQAIWLRKILEDLKLKQVKPTAIMCDNQSSVAMAKNLMHHRRTKHIKMKFHAVREAEKNGEVELMH
ncbi:uncharacterized protein LOC116107157 [Pistacia vera]|uniref:uncharacterized protein LOC116107157 n=1 Tax=Pistacia vera TaxID=55513 RepID=UPI001263B6B4|nr:uncharacterized protein LOC116107157 [Pistacia vera]